MIENLSIISNLNMPMKVMTFILFAFLIFLILSSIKKGVRGGIFRLLMSFVLVVAVFDISLVKVKESALKKNVIVGRQISNSQKKQEEKAVKYDRYIELIDKQAFAIVGEKAEFIFKVADDKVEKNPTNATSFSIYENGDLIATKEVELNKTFKIFLPIKHGGKNVFEAKILVKEKDASKVKTSMFFSINAVKDRLKFLLVSGGVQRGFRTWRNLLNSDAMVDLVHFTSFNLASDKDENNNNKPDFKEVLAQKVFAKNIDDFDLIIFDSGVNKDTIKPEYMANIVRYVQDGGALFLELGENFVGKNSLYNTELNKLVNAGSNGRMRKKSFDVVLTEIGEKHQITKKMFSDDFDDNRGKWLSYVGVKNVDGKVLLTTNNKKPILVIKKVKDGRLATLFSDNMWLWEKKFDGGGPSSKLMKSIIHWLMKEKDFEDEQVLDGQEVGVKDEFDEALKSDENQIDIIKNNQFEIKSLNQTKFLSFAFVAIFILLGYILCWIYEDKQKR
jgi:predicted Rdx family selenoprotein